MKYIKLFESFADLKDKNSIYGAYSLANANYLTEFLENLKRAKIKFNYDDYQNYLEIEFCGALVGDDTKKEIILNGLKEIRTYKIEGATLEKDNILRIIPMKQICL